MSNFTQMFERECPHCRSSTVWLVTYEYIANSPNYRDRYGDLLPGDKEDVSVVEVLQYSHNGTLETTLDISDIGDMSDVEQYLLENHAEQAQPVSAK